MKTAQRGGSWQGLLFVLLLALLHAAQAGGGEVHLLSVKNESPASAQP